MKDKFDELFSNAIIKKRFVEACEIDDEDPIERIEIMMNNYAQHKLDGISTRKGKR